MAATQELHARLAMMPILEPLTVVLKTAPEDCPVAPRGEECAVVTSGEGCEIVVAADGGPTPPSGTLQVA
jgi:hypothetical protein